MTRKPIPPFSVAVRCLDGERYVEDFTVHPA